MFTVEVRPFAANAAAFAAVMLFAGCAVGPDFVHPAAPQITRYAREPLAASVGGPPGAKQYFDKNRDIPEEWWKLFKSPALDALIARALQNNPTAQSALAALRAARQAVYAQEGKYFPLAQLNFNPTRQQTSAALSAVPASGASVFNLDTAQVLVSYTFDVWGLNRRTVEALEAAADTQRFQVEAAYLTLTSNIVVAAITEASLRAQIDAANQLIAINTQILGTLRSQLNAGYANRNDVAVQEAALAQAKATLPPLRKALDQQRDLLAALSGGYPSQGPREVFRLADLHLPADLPMSVPSQLVEQRPDVRAAQEQLHAASAQIGVATADMLPSFTINGNAGFMNTALPGLLAPQNELFTLAANATQTVFDAGTLFHQLKQAKDTYQAAAWTYRGTVIGAVQNVADSLHALQNDVDLLRTAGEFERAARTSFDLAQQQVRNGNANVLLLFTAEQSYLQSRIQVVQARAARLSDTAALFAALGGGWWNRREPPVEKKLDVGTGASKPIEDRYDGFETQHAVQN